MLYRLIDEICVLWFNLVRSDNFYIFPLLIPKNIILKEQTVHFNHCYSFDIVTIIYKNTTFIIAAYVNSNFFLYYIFNNRDFSNY